MSASKQRGTRWETAVVDYLRANGVPHAERRALNGARDRGDVAGVPGIVLEAKSEKAISLASYIDEAEAERVNDGAAYGIAVVKRRGRASAGDGYAVMPFAALVSLLREAGYIKEQA